MLSNTKKVAFFSVKKLDFPNKYKYSKAVSGKLFLKKNEFNSEKKLA